MEEASKLLDFNQKLDIDLLDSIVACLYNSTGEQLRLAQDILTRLKEHPDAWTRVDSILEYSQNQQTKFYALQILEEVIKTRWKILPRNQCEGKTAFFLVNLNEFLMIFLFLIFKVSKSTWLVSSSKHHRIQH
jgi:hypothetical protein